MPYEWTGLYAFEVDSHRIYEPVVAGKRPRSRGGHSSGLVGDGIYIYGGSWSRSRIDVSDLYLLHPVGATGLTWSSPKLSIPVQPSGRTRAASTIVGDELIVFGGTRGAYNFDNVWAFSFIENKWENLRWAPGMLVQGEYINTDSVHVRYGHVAFSVEKGVVVFGGYPLDPRPMFLHLDT